MNAVNKLDELLQKCSSGEITSLDDLQSPTEKSVLRRAALPRSFDERMFDELLSSPDDKEKISFERFALHPDLEAVPRADRRFRVKEDARRKLLLDLADGITSKGGQDDKRFAKKLIAYYRSEMPRNELDLLGVSIIEDAHRGAKLFVELYEKADKEFDLAACIDAVRVAEEHLSLLKPTAAANTLAELCAEKKQYLNARRLFSNEFNQTTFFYSRRQTDEAFSDLLRDESAAENAPWIFHLYATGGMGKTMFVRWLVARRCIPEPRKIPVARLDFDFLHLPTVAAYPWLVLLAIAEQLNGQIVGNPFNESLSRFAKYAALLKPPGENSDAAARAGIESELNKINQSAIDSLTQSFVKTLENSIGRKPLVIVLDTLERLVLHYRDTLIKILGEIAKIQSSYKNVRLLLAGRYNLTERLLLAGHYNLTERLPGFILLYGAHTVIYELKRFTAGEADEYLNARGLEIEEIRRAIIERCERANDGENSGGSNPFKLALVADFYQQKIVATAEEIRALERLDIEYLISRIITHIKEPTVQWLLRYAVVPRNFTFDIFKEVLAAHLREELLSGGKLDDPNRNFPAEAARFENQVTWKPLDDDDGGRQTFDCEKIWTALRNYASASGYISFNTGDESVLQIHSDVVVPMRILLETQEPIFKKLHADAALYFEKKAQAETDAERWAEAVCEAIYHCFQERAAAAGANLWREKIEAPVSQKNPRARLLVAEEITKADYVDEETGEPIRRAGGAPAVNLADLYEAHFRAIEALYAEISDAPQEKFPTVSTSVKEHFNHLFRLRRTKTRLPEDYSKPFDETALQSLTNQFDEPKQNKAKTIELLRRAVETTSSSQMLAGFEIYLGDLLGDEKEAVKHYRRAVEIIETDMGGAVKTLEIQLKIAAWYRAQRDYGQAEKNYRALIEMANGKENQAARILGLRHLADLMLELGRYDDCWKLLEEIRQSGDAKTSAAQFDNALFLSQVQARSLYQPLGALDTLKPFADLPKDLKQRAALAELSGDLDAMLMQFGSAVTQIENGKELWTSASNAGGADRARMLRLNFELFNSGNFTKVSALFKDWDALAEKSDAELTCLVEAFRIVFEFRSERREEARAVWLKLEKNKQFRALPTCSARILSIGLALGFGGDETARKLVAELEKIKPASARLRLLDLVKFAELAFNINKENQDAIVKLIAVKSEGKDVIPHALMRADVIDCCSRTATAQNVLRDAAKRAAEEKNFYAYREILLACDRLETMPAEDLVRTDFMENFRRDYASFPNLCAAACIEQAERLLKLGDAAEALELLGAAKEYLASEKGFTHQLEARLNETFGRCKQARGDAKEAHLFFNRALAVYKKLGNEAAAKKLLEPLPESKGKAAVNEKTFSIQIETTAKFLSVETLSNNESRNRRELNFSNDEQLAKIVAAQTGDIESVYKFADLCVSNPSLVEAELGKILFSDYLNHKLKKHKPGAPPSLCLESLSTAAAKMPWEFVFQQKNPLARNLRYFYRSSAPAAGSLESVKWLQTALRRLTKLEIAVDGVLGRQTTKILNNLKGKIKDYGGDAASDKLSRYIDRELKAQKDFRRAKVLIVSPRIEQQISQSRGVSYSSASIEKVYASARFAPKTLWWSEIEHLKNLLTEYQPDVLHVVSSFRALPGGGQVYFDFGFDADYSMQRMSKSASEPVQPSAAFVNDSLALLPDSKLRPLVILDAVCPPDPRETVLQLLYRNAFAAELFQLGNASGIIASGLSANPVLREWLTNSLVNYLSKTESFGDTVNFLKKDFYSADPQDGSTIAGIALFTNDPALTVLAAD